MQPASYTPGSDVQAPLTASDGPSIEYLAGFFDGEGCLYAQKESDRSIPSFQIRVSTTREEEPEYFHNRWGGSYYTHDPTAESHSKSWHWQATGETARIAVEQLLPYLRGKEKQAKVFLEAMSYKLQKRQGHNQYPEEAREPLVGYANELRSMTASKGGETL